MADSPAEELRRGENLDEALEELRVQKQHKDRHGVMWRMRCEHVRGKAGPLRLGCSDTWQKTPSIKTREVDHKPPICHIWKNDKDHKAPIGTKCRGEADHKARILHRSLVLYLPPFFRCERKDFQTTSTPPPR
eukprot:1126996-Amphidinium_carterae.1